MTDTEIARIRAELVAMYPGCHVKVTDDKEEMVAEIRDGFAVAVIERSMPHFHAKMTEVYRVIRGTLLVACGDHGHVLRKGDSITIQPGTIHFARGRPDPAWIEVESKPAWTADDHLVL